MPTPTDLRAALRDIAETLINAMLNADPEADDGNHDAAHEYLHLACGPAADRLRAIADAPPTVAELLPMVDATHEAWWQSASAPDVTLRARLDTVRGIVFEARLDDRSAWVAICALPSDLTQPARLVEVSP